MTITGTITRLLLDKGFGFIAAPDGVEYFFHRSAVAGHGFEALAHGQTVVFMPTEGPKGPRAEHVTKA